MSQPSFSPASALSFGAQGASALGALMVGQNNAATAIRQGQTAYLGAEANALNLQEAAEITDLKATETDTIMRQRLQGVLANIQAVSASANVDMRSPSVEAVYSRTEKVAQDQDYAQIFNAHLQSAEDRSSALLQLWGGQNALQAGYSNASSYQTSGLLTAAGGLMKGLSGMMGSAGWGALLAL